MIQIISSNLANIIVGVIVFSVITLAVIKLVRDKKNHKSSCGGGCAGCPSKGMCHPK